MAGSLLYVVVPHGCEPSASLLTPPSHAIIASPSPPWITDAICLDHGSCLFLVLRLHLGPQDPALYLICILLFGLSSLDHT